MSETDNEMKYIEISDNENSKLPYLKSGEWKFQYDNCIYGPIFINVSDKFFVLITLIKLKKINLEISFNKNLNKKEQIILKKKKKKKKNLKKEKYRGFEMCDSSSEIEKIKIKDKLTHEKVKEIWTLEYILDNSPFEVILNLKLWFEQSNKLFGDYYNEGIIQVLTNKQMYNNNSKKLENNMYIKVRTMKRNSKKKLINIVKFGKIIKVLNEENNIIPKEKNEIIERHMHDINIQILDIMKLKVELYKFILLKFQKKFSKLKIKSSNLLNINTNEILNKFYLKIIKRLTQKQRQKSEPIYISMDVVSSIWTTILPLLQNDSLIDQKISKKFIQQFDGTTICLKLFNMNNIKGIEKFHSFFIATDMCCQYHWKQEIMEISYYIIERKTDSQDSQSSNDIEIIN